MTSMRERIKGSIPALITPMKNGKVDEAAVRKFVSWQIEQGSQGLVPFPKAGQQNFYLRGDGTWQDAVGAAVAAAISSSTSINEIFKQQNFI